MTTRLGRKTAVIASFLLALFAATSGSALAADGGKSYVALNLGMSFPTVGGKSVALGLSGATRLTPLIALGAYYLTYGSSVETTSGSASRLSADSSTKLYGVQAEYSFDASFSAGLRLGLISTSTQSQSSDISSSVSVDQSSSSLFIAPKIGYDVPAGGSFAIGGELSYFKGMSDSTPSGLMLLGVGKFLF